MALFSTKRSKEREALFLWVGPIVSHETWLFAKATAASSSTSRISSATASAPTRMMRCPLRRQGLAEQLVTTTDNRINARKLQTGRIDLSAAGGLWCRHLPPGRHQPGLRTCQDLRLELYIAFTKDSIPPWSNAGARPWRR